MATPLTTAVKPLTKVGFTRPQAQLLLALLEG